MVSALPRGGWIVQVLLWQTLSSSLLLPMVSTADSVEESADVCSTGEDECRNEVIAAPSNIPMDHETDETSVDETDIQEILDSWRKNPTEGQHLILVERQRQRHASVLQLDANTVYSLQQQQRSNTTSQGIALPLMLKSHLGWAIDTLSEESPSTMLLGQESYISVGLKRAADTSAIPMRLVQVEDVDADNPLDRPDDVRQYRLESSGRLLLLAADLVPGAPVTLTVNVSDQADPEPYRTPHRSQFIIQSDGSVSPTQARHLAIGVALYPAVTLVPRDSRHRFIVPGMDSFWSKPAPSMGTPMVLSSHPGLGLVASSSFGASFGVFELQSLVVGPVQDAIHLFPLDNIRHQEFVFMDRAEHGRELVPFNLQLEEGVALVLMKYNTTDKTGPWLGSLLEAMVRWTGNSTWIVNDEGSISPRNAPHLVWGCEHVPGGGRAGPWVPSDSESVARHLVRIPPTEEPRVEGNFTFPWLHADFYGFVHAVVVQLPPTLFEGGISFVFPWREPEAFRTMFAFFRSALWNFATAFFSVVLLFWLIVAKFIRWAEWGMILLFFLVGPLTAIGYRIGLVFVMAGVKRFRAWRQRPQVE